MEKDAKYSQSPILAYVRRRIYKNNQNLIIVIVGGTGSGKSFSSIALAEALDPKFDPRLHVAFSVPRFMEILNSKPPKGTVLILEESGVLLSSREWYSQSNKMMSKILQTYRHRNLITVFNLPDFSFLDKSARKLCHVIAQTKMINYTQKKCYLKWAFVDNNSHTGKTYFPYLRYTILGTTRLMKSLSLPLPRPKNIRIYDKAKEEFTEGLNITVGAKLTEEIIEKDTTIKQLTQKQQRIYDYAIANPKLKNTEMATHLGITNQYLGQVFKAVRNKGYIIDRTHPVGEVGEIMRLGAEVMRKNALAKSSQL